MLYKKWEYIFSQARQTLTPDSLICELHFRTGLIYKKGVDKSGKLTYALREGALPKLSPTGIMRLPGPGSSVPSPSTTVQVVKKTESPSVKPVLGKWQFSLLYDTVDFLLLRSRTERGLT